MLKGRGNINPLTIAKSEVTGNNNAVKNTVTTMKIKGEVTGYACTKECKTSFLS